MECGQHTEQWSPSWVLQKKPGLHLHTVSFRLEHSCQVTRFMAAGIDRAMRAPAGTRGAPLLQRVPESSSAQPHLPEVPHHLLLYWRLQADHMWYQFCPTGGARHCSMVQRQREALV